MPGKAGRKRITAEKFGRLYKRAPPDLGMGKGRGELTCLTLLDSITDDMALPYGSFPIMCNEKGIIVMVSAKTKVINPQGMHMRPAQVFVTEMSKFQSDVTIVFNGKPINEIGRASCRERV